MKNLLFFLVIQGAFMNILSAQWTSGADIPETIRAGNTESIVENGKGYIYLFGGRNGQEAISNKTYRYSFTDNSWETMANLPTPILGSSSARIGDNIFIIGGLVTTPGTITKKVYQYKIPTNTWSQVADIPNAYTDGDAVAYQDSLVYTVGSYSNEKTFVYNVNTNKWRAGSPVPSSGFALTYGAVSVSGNKLIYVGGSNGTFNGLYWNTVWIGDIDQNDRSLITWTEGTPFPGETRTFFELRSWKNGVILIGGTTDNSFETTSNENYFYDPQSNIWVALTPKPTAWNTGNAASIFLDGTWKLFCTGGFNEIYLKATEIYSEDGLGTADNGSDACSIKNLKVIHGKDPRLIFCTKESGIFFLKIYALTGSLVRESTEKAKLGNNVISLANSKLSPGIYFVTLSQNGIQQSKKIQIVQ